jgi:hypothetical protein
MRAVEATTEAWSRPRSYRPWKQQREQQCQRTDPDSSRPTQRRMPAHTQGPDGLRRVRAWPSPSFNPRLGATTQVDSAVAPVGSSMPEPRSARSPRCAHIDDRLRLGTIPGQPRSEGRLPVSELDRLETAVSECREMIREAHAATKDLRAAVREAKRELQDLAKDEVGAHIQREVSRQLEELGERTREAVSTATQKVIAEFDRFGESLLGKETYWQTASGRRAVTRPDTDVVPPDIRPCDSKPEG